MRTCPHVDISALAERVLAVLGNTSSRASPSSACSAGSAHRDCRSLLIGIVGLRALQAKAFRLIGKLIGEPLWFPNGKRQKDKEA